jgi:hypothetical protein
VNTNDLQLNRLLAVSAALAEARDHEPDDLERGRFCDAAGEIAHLVGRRAILVAQQERPVAVEAVQP